ncbi:MAG: hypothetical protein Kow0077_21660 [Anaerolineae bacterium]
MTLSPNPDPTQQFVYAARLEDLQATQAGCLSVQVEGHTLALFLHEDRVYAVDNRCPHMGFPLDRGTVKEGILTCHWHHARFDLASGGTFDLWADDVLTFPTKVHNGNIWVDIGARARTHDYYRARLRDGLERNIPLVIAKAVLALLDGEAGDPVEPFCIGLDFGTRYRHNGWGQGLTILTCLMDILPYLAPEERPRALYHGLSAVAQDSRGNPPRFTVRPLPALEADMVTLRRWFRQFIEVRDAEGAERCVVSALRAGATQREMADMLFTAATDHRYLQGGHVLDFINKAFEALDIAGWEYSEAALSSLIPALAAADRMEESNAWRSPDDLVAILERAFDRLSSAIKSGRSKPASVPPTQDIIPTLLGGNPQDIVDALLAALRGGCPPVDLAGLVAYAAALRIAQFHTSNEFRDWDTALHAFTFANAVHQGLQRIGPQPLHGESYVPLVRGIFDAAMTVYLNRFLNIPAARLPQPEGTVTDDPDALLAELPGLLNHQQQVDEAGRLVAGYLYVGGNPDALLAALGAALLREDRDFHTIQTVEAAFHQFTLQKDSEASTHLLIAAARYLAAHAPTLRAQGQTYQIAARLHRGDHLFEAGTE